MKRLSRFFISLVVGGALLSSCGGHETQTGSALLPPTISTDHKTKAKCGSNNDVKITPCPIKLINDASRDVSVSGPNVTNSRLAETNCDSYPCNIKQISALEWKVTGYKCKRTEPKKLVFLGAISIYGLTGSGLIQGYGTLGIKFVVKKCK